MSANVRCAGNGDARRKVVAPAPCGWKGYRVRDLAGVLRLPNPSFWRPCPHCGGRVELIGAEDVVS